MSETQPSGTERGTERIEAFSDGVFAIAITLLILDVRVPQQGMSLNLREELLHLWPSYFALVLSFVMIGIYWANHHYIFKLFEKTNHALNLLNLLFLMTISFLPFPTSVLGNYMRNATAQTTAATFYALGLLLPAATWLLMWLYAAHGRRLVDPHLEPHFVQRLTLQYAGSVALYVVALLVTMIRFKLGLAICVGLTLLYLAPPNTPAYVRSRHRR